MYNWAKIEVYWQTFSKLVSNFMHLRHLVSLCTLDKHVFPKLINYLGGGEATKMFTSTFNYNLLKLNFNLQKQLHTPKKQIIKLIIQVNLGKTFYNNYVFHNRYGISNDMANFGRNTALIGRLHITWLHLIWINAFQCTYWSTTHHMTSSHLNKCIPVHWLVNYTSHDFLSFEKMHSGALTGRLRITWLSLIWINAFQCTDWSTIHHMTSSHLNKCIPVHWLVNFTNHMVFSEYMV